MCTYTDDCNTTKNEALRWAITHRFHFYAWSLFLFYEIVLVGLYVGHFGHPVRYMVNYSINIGLFYFHAAVVLRIGLKRGKANLYSIPLLFILEIALYVGSFFCVHWLLQRYTDMVQDSVIKLDRQFVLSQVFRAGYFILFSTGYYFLENFLTQRKRAAELEKTRLENLVQIAQSENAYLRAQINPHFLFNTLDFIYHNAREAAPVAAESISALSDLMRHAVESNFDRSFVRLGEEIQQVESLINIHQLREDHSLNIRFFYDEDVMGLEIIPLVLITFVENIFKHGNLKDRAFPARIDISMDGKDLVIGIVNLISRKKFGNSLGSGMENVRKRLAYTYGEKAVLQFGDEVDERFKLNLRISDIDP